jgi:hypothetical protein
MLSCCMASNHCSFNDGILQVLDYYSIPIQGVGGLSFLKHMTGAPILSFNTSCGNPMFSIKFKNSVHVLDTGEKKYSSTNY